MNEFEITHNLVHELSDAIESMAMLLLERPLDGQAQVAFDVQSVVHVRDHYTRWLDANLDKVNEPSAYPEEPKYEAEA